MIRKSERTIEKYMRSGAQMRLFKTLGLQVVVDVSSILSAQQQDKLLKALKIIDEVCCAADDNMFCDHPYLTNEYTDVFYGSTQNAPRNDVDETILVLAKEIADGLFKRKNN